MNRKVAIIDPLGAHGSSHHFYLFGQASGLLKNDVDLSLYTNNETSSPEINGLKFFAFYKDVFKSKFKIINGIKWIIGTFFSVFHARFSGISIFHFHVFYTNVLVLFNLLVVKILFGKVVLTVHDVSSFSNSSNSLVIERLIYKLPDRIITHNEFSKSEISNLNANLTSCISIVPHGNYTPFINIQYDKEKSKEQLGIPNNRRVLLFFGMIKKVKGLEVLLSALKAVVKKNPDVLLVIAGRLWENDFSAYQKIIDENNLSEYILLHTKFIPQEDVEHYYCASDLVVLPYKKIYQSGVLMMTLSYERPALVPDLLPLKEIISDNENGFLFKTENVSDLSAKLNSILGNEGLMEQVRTKGTELINTKYDWFEIGRQTKKAYQSV
ncbi:MAG: glycosyltransferase family 4 protein [Flavobacteriales bacterium]|jgi:D-inositol-3-phosphate glycosyltransferase|nr:glycosyltransferase family 4 protein [Flavobacteriales bacterium]MBT6169794.1 glycosyltransferase family 4 protein [Flavobacteriaceae bacterium]